MYTLTLLAQSDAGSLPNFSNINVSGLGVVGILAIIGVLSLLFFAFLAAYLIFFLMDIYDWGMRREEEFPQGFLQKKKILLFFFFSTNFLKFQNSSQQLTRGLRQMLWHPFDSCDNQQMLPYRQSLHQHIVLRTHAKD